MAFLTSSALSFTWATSVWCTAGTGSGGGRSRIFWRLVAEVGARPAEFNTCEAFPYWPSAISLRHWFLFHSSCSAADGFRWLFFRGCLVIATASVHRFTMSPALHRTSRCLMIWICVSPPGCRDPLALLVVYSTQNGNMNRRRQRSTLFMSLASFSHKEVNSRENSAHTGAGTHVIVGFRVRNIFSRSGSPGASSAGSWDCWVRGSRSASGAWPSASGCGGAGGSSWAAAPGCIESPVGGEVAEDGEAAAGGKATGGGEAGASRGAAAGSGTTEEDD